MAIKIQDLPLGDRPAFAIPSAEHGGMSIRQVLYGNVLQGLLTKGDQKPDEVVTLAKNITEQALIVLSQEAAGAIPVTQAGAAAPAGP